MCTMTHFASPQTARANNYAPLHPTAFQPHQLQPESLLLPRFQVVLAGNAFFHIKDISTGRVRGFRGCHNEACALARSLESRL
ncbi:hypothetical protein B7L09_03375 [Pseudomonas mandelii]|jgi:hypothetical protein|uniref:hypothetical protein n=1 Tax=Pseudomonas TaxID=286 RepID=UPI000B974652|nr:MULTISPECIES: hypothetical protein [Pseudomonas]OYQ27752.1 hypothetical protein B7L09_03375 [Pseudomonas mandelii]